MAGGVEGGLQPGVIVPWVADNCAAVRALVQDPHDVGLVGHRHLGKWFRSRSRWLMPDRLLPMKNRGRIARESTIAAAQCFGWATGAARLGRDQSSGV